MFFYLKKILSLIFKIVVSFLLVGSIYASAEEDLTVLSEFKLDHKKLIQDVKNQTESTDPTIFDLLDCYITNMGNRIIPSKSCSVSSSIQSDLQNNLDQIISDIKSRTDIKEYLNKLDYYNGENGVINFKNIWDDSLTAVNALNAQDPDTKILTNLMLKDPNAVSKVLLLKASSIVIDILDIKDIKNDLLHIEERINQKILDIVIILPYILNSSMELGSISDIQVLNNVFNELKNKINLHYNVDMYFKIKGTSSTEFDNNIKKVLLYLNESFIILNNIHLSFRTKKENLSLEYSSDTHTSLKSYLSRLNYRLNDDSLYEEGYIQDCIDLAFGSSNFTSSSCKPRSFLIYLNKYLEDITKNLDSFKNKAEDQSELNIDLVTKESLTKEFETMFYNYTNLSELKRILSIRNLFIQNVIDPILGLKYIDFNSEEDAFEAKVTKIYSRLNEIPDEFITYSPLYDEDCTRLEKIEDNDTSVNRYWFKSATSSVLKSQVQTYKGAQLSHNIDSTFHQIDAQESTPTIGLTYKFKTDIFKEGFIRTKIGTKDTSNIPFLLIRTKDTSNIPLLLISTYKALSTLYTNYVGLQLLLLGDEYKNLSYTNIAESSDPIYKKEASLIFSGNDFIKDYKQRFKLRGLNENTSISTINEDLFIPFQNIRNDILTNLSEILNDNKKTLSEVKSIYLSNLVKAIKSTELLEKKLKDIDDKKYNTDQSVSEVLLGIEPGSNEAQQLKSSIKKYTNISEQDMIYYTNETMKFALSDYIRKAYNPTQHWSYSWFKNYWFDKEFKTEWKKRGEGDPILFTTEEKLFAWYNYLTNNMYKNDPMMKLTIDKIYAHFHLLLPIKLINLTPKRVHEFSEISKKYININNTTIGTPMELVSGVKFEDIESLNTVKYTTQDELAQKRNELIDESKKLVNSPLSDQDKAWIQFILGIPTIGLDFTSSVIQREKQTTQEALNIIYSNFPPVRYLKECKTDECKKLKNTIKNSTPIDNHLGYEILTIYRNFLSEEMDKYINNVNKLYTDSNDNTIQDLRQSRLNHFLINNYVPNAVLMQKVLHTNPELKPAICRLQKEDQKGEKIIDNISASLALASIIPGLEGLFVFGAGLESVYKIGKAIGAKKSYQDSLNLSLASASSNYTSGYQSDVLLINELKNQYYKRTTEASIATAIGVAGVATTAVQEVKATSQFFKNANQAAVAKGAKYAKYNPGTYLSYAVASAVKTAKNTPKVLIGAAKNMHPIQATHRYFTQGWKKFLTDMKEIRVAYYSRMNDLVALSEAGKISGFGKYSAQVTSYLMYKYKQARRLLAMSSLLSEHLPEGWKTKALQVFGKSSQELANLHWWDRGQHLLWRAVEFYMLFDFIRQLYEEDPNINKLYSHPGKYTMEALFSLSILLGNNMGKIPGVYFLYDIAINVVSDPLTYNLIQNSPIDIELLSTIRQRSDLPMSIQISSLPKGSLLTPRKIFIDILKYDEASFPEQLKDISDIPMIPEKDYRYVVLDQMGRYAGSTTQDNTQKTDLTYLHYYILKDKEDISRDTICILNKLIQEYYSQD